MSWTRKVGHPSEVLKKGDKVTCVVLNVDQERKRDRPGPQAAERGPVGDRHPRPLPARRRGQGARSPSSPTSASSSSWSRAWKACCTSPSWPTTRSRAPRRSSRSATRSRSRSSASTAPSARSASRARRPSGRQAATRRATRKARPSRRGAPHGRSPRRPSLEGAQGRPRRRRPALQHGRRGGAVRGREHLKRGDGP